MRPESYRIQDGCWNCEHCVDNSDVDLIDLYCGFSDMFVPQSSNNYNFNSQRSEQSADLWHKWASEKRTVKPVGICIAFKRKPCMIPK